MRLALRGLAVVALLAAALTAVAVAGAGGQRHVAVRPLDPGTRFLVPLPNQGAVQQGIDLLRHGQLRNALLIGKMVTTPQAVWVTKGKPGEARAAVRKAVLLADAEHAVAVLVAYDIPGRDCGGLSAGGALTPADYTAWIDGFASGIGHHKALVMLEPDGLGLLPSNCGGPNPSYPFTDADRFAELNYAVTALTALPNTLVYLDGTHPGWLNVGDASTRLVQAGVQRAQGFFLNVSNYHYTANDAFYGTWISDCIAYGTQIAPGDFGNCPNQYWDGGPATNWDGDALDTSQVWRDAPYSGVHADLKWNTVGIDSRWASMLGTVTPTTHFVVDTSRNGRGPWTPTASYPDKQDWCNPPGRGLGVRPTANTGAPLLDAYLWVKVPGESDGSCNRGIAGSTTDPEWGGIVDPAAGQWFPQQALQLAQLASPPLLP